MKKIFLALLLALNLIGYSQQSKTIQHNEWDWTNGLIGIGTTTPSATLDLIGTLRIRNGAFGGAYLKSDGLGNAAWATLPINDTLDDWSLTGNNSTNSGVNFVGTIDNASLAFRTNNTVAMYIDSSTQNVGIGTTAPPVKLTIAGETYIGFGGIEANVTRSVETLSHLWNTSSIDNSLYFVGVDSNAIATKYSGAVWGASNPNNGNNYLEWVGRNNGDHPVWGTPNQYQALWNIATTPSNNLSQYFQDELNVIFELKDSINQDSLFVWWWWASSGPKFTIKSTNTSCAIQLDNGTAAIGDVLTATTTHGDATWQTPTGLFWGTHGNLVDTSMFFGSKNIANLTFKDSGSFAAEIGVDTFNNTFFGIGAGANAQGYALQYSGLNRGGKNNVGIGGHALEGYLSASGNYCTAVGVAALTYDTAFGNTAVGYFAGSNNITGAYNTAVGFAALTNTANSFNVGIGDSALSLFLNGSGNTAVGGSAGVNVGNCTNCTFVGHFAQEEGSVTLTNASSFGAGAEVGSNNTIVLGDSTKNTVVSIGTNYAHSALTVANGDIYVAVESGNSGLILVDTGGNCWRIKVTAITGVLTTTAITCP